MASPPADPPLVSVVIPCAGPGPRLATQLRAVLGQTGVPAFEVVVSLNTADPGRVAAVRDLVEALGDPRLRTVDSSDRRGAAHARNVGARAAAGELLAFCDDDDRVHDGWLAALVAGLGSHDAVSGPCLRIAPPGQEHWRPPATEGRLPTFLGIAYVLSGNLAVRRAAFDAVGGFDEKLTRCEDIALGWALQNAGCSIGFEPDAGIDYYDRGGLRALLHQHYLYGKGMAQVLARYPKPGGDGRVTGTVGQLRPNLQRARLTPVAVLRKISTGAGRLVGLVQSRRSALARSRV